MAKARYIVGIDLGTTNSVAAYLDTRAPVEELAQVPVFGITQLVGPGQIASREKLPSFLYLPNPHELPEGSLRLPWNRDRAYAVGEFARGRGAQVPGRLVASAKSWLCHAEVDRTAAILPWGAPEEVERVSPIQASAEFLRHLREAWDYEMAQGREDARLADQEVILTVPASFDEVARELTVEAANEAGLERVTLIEEPQAAFYSWLFYHREDWRAHVRPDQLILVCDVGGGTSDFSLIRVEGTGGELGFRRIAVGDHLLLGGDNMDLALAAELEETLAGPGRKLDATQWSALQHACRSAKETLLSDGGKESVSVALPGRGSRLVGGALRAELRREQVIEWIREGFFPLSGIDEAPQRSARTGIQEFGLPYAPDPAVSRHLATFLRDPTGREEHTYRRPDLVLFNGGAFKPELLRDRIIELLGSWFRDSGAPRVLMRDPTDLDLAVARGAAYYGLVRRGEGVRITGGTARSFYVGIGLASEAAEEGGRQEAICVAPQGLEEAQEVEVPNKEFDLLIRRPVHFPYYSSSTRPLDRVGDIVKVDEATMRPLPPIRTILRSGKKSSAEQVRVRLHAILTEVGTLELWCVATEGNRRWRLQFEVRKDPDLELPGEQTSGDVSEEEVLDPAVLEAAATLIETTFEPAASRTSKELTPAKLMKNLEATLRRSRTNWPPGALRGLWPVLLKVAERRKTDPVCESRWLNLAGFLLRPGYGYPMDEWRVKEVWRLFHKEATHHKDVQVRAEFWVLWRRVAGGLNKGQQSELFRRMLPDLLPQSSKKRPRPGSRKVSQEEMEMWRAAASLERISPKEKRQLGEALVARLKDGDGLPFEFWALGRIGARVPFYGPVDTVVGRESAESWIRELSKVGDLTNREAVFALVQLARRCGDRAREIDEDLRRAVLDLLRSVEANEHFLKLVSEVTELEAAEQAQAFGESLPPALRLVAEG